MYDIDIKSLKSYPLYFLEIDRCGIHLKYGLKLKFIRSDQRNSSLAYFSLGNQKNALKLAIIPNKYNIIMPGQYYTIQTISLLPVCRNKTILAYHNYDNLDMGFALCLIHNINNVTDGTFSVLHRGDTHSLCVIPKHGYIILATLYEGAAKLTYDGHIMSLS